MDIDPSDRYQLLPDAVPVPRACDDLDVSCASPIPCSRKAGALGRVDHDLLRGREFWPFTRGRSMMPREPAAGHAALTLPYSNGPVEGPITTLQFLTRPN